MILTMVMVMAAMTMMMVMAAMLLPSRILPPRNPLALQARKLEPHSVNGRQHHRDRNRDSSVSDLMSPCSRIGIRSSMIARQGTRVLNLGAQVHGLVFDSSIAIQPDARLVG